MKKLALAALILFNAVSFADEQALRVSPSTLVNDFIASPEAAQRKYDAGAFVVQGMASYIMIGEVGEDGRGESIITFNASKKVRVTALKQMKSNEAVKDLDKSKPVTITCQDGAALTGKNAITVQFCRVEEQQ